MMKALCSYGQAFVLPGVTSILGYYFLLKFSSH